MKYIFKNLAVIITLSAASLATDGYCATIIYSANRQGEIRDCGCQVHQVGGIDRYANFIKKRREKAESEPLIVDSGDTFYPSEKLNPFRKNEYQWKAQVIARAYRLMGVDALTPGERDLALGLENLKQLQESSGVPFIISNSPQETEISPFKKFITLSKGNNNYLILGLIDPEVMRNQAEIKLENPLEGFRKTIAGLEKKMELKSYRIIVLSHLGLSKDKELASLREGLLIFGSHSMDVIPKPVQINKSFVFQTANQGQQAGILEFNTAKGSIDNHQLVDMDTSYAQKNNVSPLLEEYSETVRMAEIAKDKGKEENDGSSGARVVSVGENKSGSAKMKTNLESKPFVAHPYLCKNCHSEQFEFWKKTEHSSSILFLYAKNQHFDPECIGCHTLGFKDPNGFKKITKPIDLVHESAETPPFVETLLRNVFSEEWGEKKPLDSRIEPTRFEKLRDRYHHEIDTLESKGEILKNYLGVQCEHCHGNRNGHPAENRKPKPVSLSTCKECHRPPNVPHFDPKSIKLVSCPKIKQERKNKSQTKSE